MATRRARRFLRRGGKALAAVAKALSELPGPGMLIGGLAVVIRGVPRLTRDVDVTVAPGILTLQALADDLARHHLVPQ